MGFFSSRKAEPTPLSLSELNGPPPGSVKVIKSRFVSTLFFLIYLSGFRVPITILWCWWRFSHGFFLAFLHRLFNWFRTWCVFHRHTDLHVLSSMASRKVIITTYQQPLMLMPGHCHLAQLWVQPWTPVLTLGLLLRVNPWHPHPRLQPHPSPHAIYPLMH